MHRGFDSDKIIEDKQPMTEKPTVAAFRGFLSELPPNLRDGLIYNSTLLLGTATDRCEAVSLDDYLEDLSNLGITKVAGIIAAVGIFDYFSESPVTQQANEISHAHFLRFQGDWKGLRETELSYQNLHRDFEAARMEELSDLLDSMREG